MAESIRSKPSPPCGFARNARGCLVLLTRRSQTPSRGFGVNWVLGADYPADNKDHDQVPHDRRGLLGSSR